MRGLLVSLISVGLLTPVAYAFAAENDVETTRMTENAHGDAREARAEERRERQRARRREERRERARRKRRRQARSADVGGVPRSTLDAIAACESGGDPAAIGGGGAFRGKYQFTQSTWEAVGGSGDPAEAPEAEQDRRAAILYQQSGPGQWPVCGQ